MRTDITARTPHDDRADDIRRALLSDPNYAHLVHPVSGRVLPIATSQQEVIRRMVAAGWKLEGERR
jgi:hypothetical protein